MDKITRRLFLRHSALAGAAATVAVPVAVEAMEPDDRIKAAFEELQAAMKARYPDWRLQTRNDFQHSEIYRKGGNIQGNPYCHAILLYASSEKYGREEARWFRTYEDEKLLADDVAERHASDNVGVRS
jgi:hypothetical protein